MKNSSLVLYIISSLLVILEGIGLFIIFASLALVAYGILSGGLLVLIGIALFVFALINKFKQSIGSGKALLVFSAIIIYLGGMFSGMLTILAQMNNCDANEPNKAERKSGLVPLFTGILLLISLILILIQPLLHLVSSAQTANLFSNLDFKFIMPFLFFSMILSYVAFIKKGEKKIAALLFLFLLIILTKQFKDTFFIHYLMNSLFAVHGFSRELMSSVQVVGALFYLQNFILLLFIGVCIISKSKSTKSLFFLTIGILVLLTAIIPTLAQFASAFIYFDSNKILDTLTRYVGNIPFIILFVLLCIKLFKRKACE